MAARNACKLDCEGIVSKGRGSRYGRDGTHDWLKVKNPDARCGGRGKRIGADEAEPR
jgi:ATP-dependent DNA ligase